MQTPDAYLCRRRAKHVFTETLRVLQFADTCTASAEGKLTGEEALSVLGELMNGSHASCRDLFDVSCPELNKLTSLALYDTVSQDNH